MLILDLFKMAIRSLISHKLRTFLTALGIIIGVASVISMISIGEGARQQTLSTISKFGTYIITIKPGNKKSRHVSTGKVDTLMLKDATFIEQNVPLITGVAAQVYRSAQLKFGNKNTIIISADIENQINELSGDEKNNYMKMIELKETGLNILIQKGYKILELETYFTSGPEETRAWTIQKNCTAPKAAGEIHTDFEKGFIRAETVAYDDFIENQGWLNSKTNGKMRLEGKDYIVKDGDVLNFRFNT